LFTIYHLLSVFAIFFILRRIINLSISGKVEALIGGLQRLNLTLQLQIFWRLFNKSNETAHIFYFNLENTFETFCRKLNLKIFQLWKWTINSDFKHQQITHMKVWCTHLSAQQLLIYFSIFPFGRSFLIIRVSLNSAPSCDPSFCFQHLVVQLMPSKCRNRFLLACRLSYNYFWKPSFRLSFSHIFEIYVVVVKQRFLSSRFTFDRCVCERLHRRIRADMLICIFRREQWRNERFFILLCDSSRK
jgi:hypothetical protein